MVPVVGSFPEESPCDGVVVEVIPVDEVDADDHIFAQISDLVKLVVHPLLSNLKTEVVLANDVKDLAVGSFELRLSLRQRRGLQVLW